MVKLAKRIACPPLSDWMGRCCASAGLARHLEVVVILIPGRLATVVLLEVVVELVELVGAAVVVDVLVPDELIETISDSTGEPDGWEVVVEVVVLVVDVCDGSVGDDVVEAARVLGILFDAATGLSCFGFGEEFRWLLNLSILTNRTCSFLFLATLPPPPPLPFGTPKLISVLSSDLVLYSSTRGLSEAAR